MPKEKVALNLSKKRVAETQDVIEPQHKKIKPVNTRKQTALQNITNVYQSKPKNVESCNEFVVKKVTKTYSAKRTKIDKIDTNAIWYVTLHWNCYGWNKWIYHYLTNFNLHYKVTEW